MINNTIIMIEVKSLIMRKTIKLIIKIKEMINHTTHTKETKDLPMIEIKNLNMQWDKDNKDHNNRTLLLNKRENSIDKNNTQNQ